ncbi:hypothetical protein BC829DRAFT_69960 [Chytridium lagenaria]|nr:hypothetical protein BC829DRAFT_69960 [Chytridium lagenaria]
MLEDHLLLSVHPINIFMQHGVLGVKIRSACLIQYDSVLHTNTNTFCAISVRSITRRTRVVQNIEGTLKWDQIKHFPVPIVRNRRHPYNLIKIVLHSFEANNPDHLTELGSVSFHMHDVMKASPIAGTYDLWNENVQVGDIDMELTFNYGRFGYGYSYQLEEEDATAEEVVQYSLLPRIIPPRDQREPDEAVMVVCATPHPKFIPFKEVVHLSYGKEIKEVLEEASEHAYKPSALVKEMGSFEKIRDTVGSLNTMRWINYCKVLFNVR